MLSKKEMALKRTFFAEDERKNITTFFNILLNVNKRTAKESQSTKTKDKTSKMDYSKKARLNVGPLLLYLVYLFIWVKTMIDTIVLLISKNDYTITHPDYFTPSAYWAINNTEISLSEHHRAKRGIVSKQNPTAKELRSGIYKPRLTLSYRKNVHGNSENVLKIEFSLPKLIFGNNFNELSLKDFPALIKKLILTLATMGVSITASALEKAPIIGVHYSKNILLTDGSTPHYFISKIKEANVRLSLDVNQTDYRNDGYSFKWHSNAYEVIFYDKIKDLEKTKQSSKRSVEKDGTVQLKLLSNFTKRHKLEILRMEVRLNKRQKIKQLFEQLELSSALTFKSMFKPATSKKILLHYLDEIEHKRPLLLDYTHAPDKTFLTRLIMHNQELSAKQLFQIFGLQQALKTTTIRELKMMLGPKAARSLERLLNEAQKIELPTQHQRLSVLREHLVKFKPLKLVL